MIDPICPDCLCEGIQPDGHSEPGQWRCVECGARFDLERALITLGEAVDFRSAMETEPMFTFHRDLAEVELQVSGGELLALNPYSDAAEIQRALDAAAARRVIEARRVGAVLRVYLSTRSKPHPVLGVDDGIGAALIGPTLSLQPEPNEDPVTFTLRWLAQMVDDANNLLAGRLCATSGRRPSAADTGADGPRLHRAVLENRRRRAYVVVAYRLRSDSKTGETFAAEGSVIATVLAGIGERIEAEPFGVGEVVGMAVMLKGGSGTAEESAVR